MADPFGLAEKQNDPFGLVEQPVAESSILRRIPDLAVTALKGAIGVPETAVGLADIVTGGQAGKLAEAVGFKPKEAKEIIDQWYSPQQQEANLKVQEAQGFFPTLGAMLKNPSTILNAVIESAPSMIGGAGAARGLLKVAPKVTPVIAGAIGEGLVGAGQAAEGIRQESETGTLTAAQAGLAWSSGALTSLFGAMGGKLAQRLGIGDIDTLMAGGGVGAVVNKEAQEAKKGVFRKVVESAISEGAFEELPQSAQERIAQNLAMGRPAGEGVAEAAASGMLAGFVMGGFGGAGGHILDTRTERDTTLSNTKPDVVGVTQMEGTPPGPPKDKTTTEIEELQSSLTRDLGIEDEFKPSQLPAEAPTPQGVAPDYSGIAEAEQRAAEIHQAPPQVPELTAEAPTIPTVEAPLMVPTEAAEPERGPNRYFGYLEGEPLTSQETTGQAIARLSQKTERTSHEEQQLADLSRLQEMPDTTGTGISLKDETRYLFNRVAEQTGDVKELSDMVKWYAQAYPKDVGMKALRNKLLDTLHGGQFNEAQHAEYRAEIRRFTDAGKGIYPIAEGEKQRPVGMIPKKASRTFPVQFRDTVDQWVGANAAQWGRANKGMAFAMTEPQVDEIVERSGLKKEAVLEYLGGKPYNGKTGIPVIPYKEAYKMEFEREYPKPKKTKEARPLYAWLSKNFKGTISRESLKRAFGDWENVKALNLHWLAGGHEDFYEVVSEQTEGNPFHLWEGETAEETRLMTDLSEQAAELLRQEQKAAKEGQSHANAVQEWESMREDYVQERIKGKETALTDDTADEFISEEDMEQVLLDRAKALGDVYVKEVQSLINNPDIPFHEIDKLISQHEVHFQKGEIKFEGEQLDLFKQDKEHQLREGARILREKAAERKKIRAEEMGYSSVEEMEAEDRAKAKLERKGRARSFWYGEEVEEKKGKAYEANPYSLIAVAKEYGSAEQFEREWNPAAIERNLKASPHLPEYGMSREPMPVSRCMRVIKNILDKWDTNLETVRAEGANVIRSKRDLRVLQQALEAQQVFLSASGIAPANLDYKQFWEDVHSGMKFDPKGPITKDNLSKHFLTGDDKAQEDLFHRAAKGNPTVRAIDTTEGVGWVLTTEQFLKNIGKEKEFKPAGYWPRASSVREAKAPIQEVLFQRGSLFPYQNAPDNLMGFSKDPAKQKGYFDVKYKFEQPVKVTFDDGMVHYDIVNGLNKAHALERARRNWEGAKIEATTKEQVEEAATQDKSKALFQAGFTTQPSTLPDLARQIINGNTQTFEGDPFKRKQVVATDSVRPEVAGVIQGWLKLFSLDTKVFVAGASDLQDTGSGMRYDIWGHKRSRVYDIAEAVSKDSHIWAATAEVEFGDNERFIVLSDKMLDAWNTDRAVAVENLAHEFGHLLKWMMFDKASFAERRGILDAYEAWERNITNGTVQDYLSSVKTPFRERELDVKTSLDDSFKTVKDWRRLSSFDEWFADQVSRWMVTKDKPQSVVDKFFSRMAQMFKKLWASVDKFLYRPALPVEEWLDRKAGYEAEKPAQTGITGLPLFDNEEDQWRNGRIEAIKSDADWLKIKDVGKLIDAYLDEEKAGNAPGIFPKFDEADWQKEHFQQSIEFADDKLREATQQAETRLNDDMIHRSRADKPFWRNFRGIMDKYGIMKKRDIGVIESVFANPFFLGYRYPDIQRAVNIQQTRDKTRNQLIADLMKTSNTFFRTEGETLKNVEKALIEGDRELRQRYIDLLKEGDEGKAQAAELKRLNGYSDTELFTRFKLNAEGIAAYRQVRNTLDTLHERWLKQIEERALATHKNQKWYALLKSLYGANLTDDEASAIRQKLGAVYDLWHKSLNAAKVPLENLLHTPETLRAMNIKIEGIVAQAINDLQSGEELTEERVRKILKRAEAKIRVTAEKASPELNETQTKAMVREYTKQYKKALGTINDLRDTLRDHLGMGKGISDTEINRELRGFIQAYGMMQPQMRELREIRNELGEWIGYFPRERDDSKLHYIAVFQNVRDEKGDIIGKRTLYLNYYNIGAIGGQQLRKEVEAAIKAQGWQDCYVDSGRNVKEADSTFFKVSDMNTQRIIDNAINSSYLKGKISQKEGEGVRQMLLQAISDEMNQRGFGKHRLHRQVAFDEDGKMRTVLGYKETGLKDVLKNYITGYAGMETKQFAAISFTDLLGEMGVGQKGVRDYIHNYAQENLRNQERIDKISGGMRAVAFAWYLGGNFKSVFVQLTQNYVTGIPILAQMTRHVKKGLGEKAGFMEAERSYHRAMKDNATGNLTAGERKFIAEAIDKGITMDQYIQEITGQISKSFGGKYRRVVGALSYFFSQAETFNRKSAALASYRLFKEAGYETNNDSVDSQAGRAVEEYVNRTHYLMGKANLPKSMMGGDFTAQTLRAAYTFRSFTHNYLLSMMPQYGGDARTALHSLAYLVLLGGMLSAPFMKDLFDWWEKRTGENILGDVRRELRKYGGKTLETFGIYGLAGLALGDISGSLGIGIPFVGEPTDTMYGVWGGMARKAKQAGEAVDRGDWYRGVENIAPEAMANIMRGMRMSEFGKDLIGTPGYATTAKGRPIFDENGKPVSMDTLDAFRKIIGFQPREYSEKMQAQRAVKNTEDYFKRKHDDIIQEYKIAKVNINKNGMAEAMKRIKEYNKERVEKEVQTIVPMLKLSNVIKAARQVATKKERREAGYKRRELEG